LRRLRKVHSPGLTTCGVRTPVTDTNNLATSIQKDNVLVPYRIGTLQNMMTIRARHLLGAIVTLGALSLIFGCSHRLTSRTRMLG
jgi:hypothetical protein